MVDEAAVLSPGQRAALAAKLERYEQETGHQIAVLTVPSLEGEAVEAYSMRVVEAWQLGDADFDNGALLVVAPADRQVRIEVGYGLEGAVPDAVAARIIREGIVPRFRAGDLPGGIEAGVDALLAAARGEVVALRPRSAPSPPGGEPLMLVLMICVFSSAVFGGLFRRRGRPLGALLSGGVAGGLSGLVLASVAWGAAAFALGALFGFIGPMGGFGLPGGGRHRGGSGGGFGGGGFGGGGFGGGGGGFGGGGASGSW